MKTKIILVLALSVLALSCKNKTEQTPEEGSGFIEITKAQFESEKMTIGEPELYPFSEKVHFTGTIIPTLDGQAQISLPFSGVISNIRCKPNEMVKKGSVLFEISGHELVDLQKDFSESTAILSKLRSEYRRAEELYNENISTQKDFITAESNYYAENARNKALKTKLEGMGLEVARIEKGEFYQSFPVISPISGFVSNIVVSLGQYVGPEQTIAEVIDNDSFQLKLNVFEKDIDRIRTGQTAEFSLNANESKKIQATINVIGKSIQPDSKSIECYATIINPGSINLVSNQFVEGEISATLDSVLAVPETAIISSENEQYVLMFEKEENAIYYFRKVTVTTGRKANNYIELTGQKPIKSILLTGTYNIVIE